MKIKPDTWLTIGAVGAGGYLLYKLFGGVSQVAKDANDSVVNSIAKWFTNLPAADINTGNVILPNGASVAMNTLSSSGTVRATTNPDGSAGASFQWQGATYYLNSPSDASGNWQASTSPGGAVDFGVTGSGASGGW